MRVKALTYNLFWWNLYGRRGGNGGSAGKLVQSNVQGEPFDIVAFQECDDPGRIMGEAGMNNGEYDHIRWGSNTLAFRSTRWTKLSQGDGILTSEDLSRKWKRGVHWVRLEEKTTSKKLFVMNHHGPLPVNSGGVCGGEATAINMMKIMIENSAEGDALLLTGDFNADEGSTTVRFLKGRMHHVITSWVYNFFTNCGGDSVL
jgi:endonuclease/exonuclease/phosphatase family metal-dependent hydrolase